MAAYFEEKEFSEKMMPLVETVLHRIDKQRLFGPLLNDSYKISYANEAQDQQYATDLVLQARNLNISVRVRRAEALLFWPQITLSEGKEYKVITSTDYVDAYFVGIASFDETRLSHWLILNLHQFRACLRNNPRFFPVKRFRNRRGQKFLGYALSSSPTIPDLVIDASHPLFYDSGGIANLQHHHQRKAAVSSLAF